MNARSKSNDSGESRSHDDMQKQAAFQRKVFWEYEVDSSIYESESICEGCYEQIMEKMRSKKRMNLNLRMMNVIIERRKDLDGIERKGKGTRGGISGCIISLEAVGSHGSRAFTASLLDLLLFFHVSQ